MIIASLPPFHPSNGCRLGVRVSRGSLLATYSSGWLTSRLFPTLLRHRFELAASRTGASSSISSAAAAGAEPDWLAMLRMRSLLARGQLKLYVGEAWIGARAPCSTCVVSFGFLACSGCSPRCRECTELSCYSGADLGCVLYGNNWQGWRWRWVLLCFVVSSSAPDAAAAVRLPCQITGQSANERTATLACTSNLRSNAASLARLG